MSEEIEKLFKDMAQSIIDGDSDLSVELAEKSIAMNIPPLDAITKGFVIGVNYIGDQFGAGEAFLPELVMAGEAMKAAVATLEPELLKLGEARETMGKVILATVEGDIHEIGKTLVGTMLSASGFEVTDLGVDQPADKIIGKALEIDAQIIGLSALLTTTMVRQREIIEELDKENLRPRIKVMVGGAPITRDWATKIKADGTSEDAVGAVALAKQLVGKA
ncbi:MAG TPA: corrinoid protein [Anaerolineales bacterium]|nr:corrinoid protein [Anaerolineales bacterium]HNE04750.1 corrinoid protein [Anaerolineales bacterium]HNF94418.1 corrinoid protein [Anaerolineales bacterium]HNH26291.1 corrinoid protein [Anaerolineales bacterium]HNM37855.1 corrinoid protein [Anaerolineales bacterium]